MPNFLMISPRVVVKDRNPRQNLVPFVAIKTQNRHRFGLSKTTRCLLSSGTGTPKVSWKSNRILKFEQKGKRRAFPFLALICLRQSITWWIWGSTLIHRTERFFMSIKLLIYIKIYRSGLLLCSKPLCLSGFFMYDQLTVYLCAGYQNDTIWGK